MKNEIQGYVSGDGIRPYSIRFAAHLLDAKIKKYYDKGAVLRLGQAHPMQPAAPAIVTPKLWQNEGLSPARGSQKGVKKERSLVSRPVVSPAKVKPAKTVKLRRVEKKKCAKPVVCITTGNYYGSMIEAARACGGTDHGISRQIQPMSRQKSHRGVVHRLATKAEIKAKQML